LARYSFLDFHGTSGRFGVEYDLDEEDSVELRYKYSNGNFPNFVPGEGLLPQDFRESTLEIVGHYEPSDKTKIIADAGYFRHSYSDVALSNVSGDVWHVQGTWQATQKIQLVAAASSDLRAYVDVATSYFRAKDESLKLNWLPREKLTLSLMSTWEQQNYVAASNPLNNVVLRHDTLSDQIFAALYTPRDWLSLNITVALRRRDSNFSSIQFDDQQLTASFKITL